MAVRQTTRRRGYTLIEVLVALIMFTFISLATGFALSNALRSQNGVQQQADEAQEVRHLFSVLRRDISAAYASAGNKETFFVASSDTSSGSPLTFTSMCHRIDLGQQPDQQYGQLTFDASSQGQQLNTNPQSALEIVSYSWDPDSGEFRRSSTPIPNTNLIPPPTTPDTLVATGISSIQFQYLDPNATDSSTAMRDYWNYYSDPTLAGQSSGSSSQNDTTLPQAVSIQLTHVGKDHVSRTYSTAIVLATSTPQPKGQTPDTSGTGAAGGTNNSSGTPQVPGGGGQRPPGRGLRRLPGLSGIGARR